MNQLCKVRDFSQLHHHHRPRVLSLNV